MDPVLVGSWRNTERLLRAAMAELPNDGPALGAVEHWLSHYELGLAFDELTAAGDEATAPFVIWKKLSEVASAMNLTTDDSTHERAALVVQHHDDGGRTE